MSQLAIQRVSYPQYLQLEQETHVRHEFLDGVAVMMAGGTIRHSRAATVLTGMVQTQLRGHSCQPYNSDCKVRIPASGLATYPDLSIVCGAPEVHPDDPNAITNPVLLAEVLSPGTEAWDRGGKFEHYQKLTPLRHYLLIRVDVPRIEHFRREGDGTWTLTVIEAGGTLSLPDIAVELDIDALYSDLPPVTEADLPRLPRVLPESD